MGLFSGSPSSTDSHGHTAQAQGATLLSLRGVFSTPGYRRAIVLRRLAAAALLAAACISAVVDRAITDPSVVVFTRSVQPGEVLSAEDIALRPVPDDVTPDTALKDPAAAEAQVVASHADAGEVITSTRLLGPDLVSALVPEPGEYTLVPVKLAEPGIIPMLHHGDEVSVVTVGDVHNRPAGPDGPPAHARTIASGGIVVIAGGAERINSRSDAPDQSATTDGAVLLLLRGGDAETVAAASLSSPLAVVLSGRSVANSI